MAWTTVPKPNTSNYTNVNPIGKQQYDQSDIFYDQSDIYYDGFNPNQWSNVDRPLVGYDVPWSEMSMMWSEADLTWGSGIEWTKINKPT